MQEALPASHGAESVLFNNRDCWDGRITGMTEARGTGDMGADGAMERPRPANVRIPSKTHPRKFENSG